MYEFYKKYRPRKLASVVGQSSAVGVLQGYLKKKRLPHALLFTGPSGTGKTTLVRILQRELECSLSDFAEINSANFRGIDFIREVSATCKLAPMGGPVRVIMIDECHMLSRDAQNAFLKLLEDTPKHVYFMLATTDPQKLIAAIRTRCTEIALKPISKKDIRGLLSSVCKTASLTMSNEVLDEIATLTDGSARKALVVLEQVAQIADEDGQLAALQEASADTNSETIELCRSLLKRGARWIDIAPVVRKLEDDPETIRHAVLGYMTAVMLKNPKLAPRCYQIINAFRDNFYDSKKAGLVAACFEACS